MNWLLTRTGALAFGVVGTVSDLLGIFFLALRQIPFLVEAGKRRIFWHLFKRYIYNAGFRAAYINTLIAILLGWLLIGVATRVLPEGIALSEYFQSLYVIVSIREIGPLVSGIILISRSANAVTSDIGLLALNGEFEALRAQRLNPFIVCLLPVFLAFPVSLAMMFVFFNVVCILSSWLFLASLGDHSVALGQFVSGVVSQLTGHELLVSFAKAILGGSVIGIISIYFGARVRGGYESISRAISNATTAQIFAFIAINLLLSTMAYR